MRRLFLVFLMFVVSGCREKEAPRVTLLFDDGFVGTAIIRWNQPHGVEIPTGKSSYVLEVPASGLLEVQGANLMLNWYVQEARYRGGNPLVQGTQHTKDEDGVYFWDMGVSASGSESWFVVGRIKDLNGIRERKMGLPPFPATR